MGGKSVTPGLVQVNFKERVCSKFGKKSPGFVQVNFGKKLSPSKAFTVLHQESLTQRAKFYVPFSDIKYLLNTLNSATDCAQCAVCTDLLVRFKENDVTKAGTGYNLQI